MARTWLVTVSLPLAIAFIPCSLWGQADEPVRVLDSVSVEAYGAHRPLHEIPSSIGTLDLRTFNRSSNTSLLPAFNLITGVRMEERSPGSYRFSIRGSLLRSPFGVRNVKFYWNGLPLTDGGGNTYLNLLDLYAVNTAEVIKGPAGSLYGAGTGGAVLLRSAPIDKSTVSVTSLGGTYGTYRFGATVEARSKELGSRVQFVRQASDGYREQSAMTRGAFAADMSFPLGSADLMDVTILYTDLSYQTPGGLTETQYQADPRQARPPSGSLPGAAGQQAAVYNKTLLSGIQFEHQWNSFWNTSVGFVASTTQFKNPSIRNYEVRDEQNMGARLVATYEQVQAERKFRIVMGGEYQRYRAPITVSANAGGTPGALLSQDEITSTLGMGFAQGEIEFQNGLQVVAGLSINYSELEDKRSVPPPNVTQERIFNPIVLPRVALLKPVSTSISMFASVSRGFSPPTTAEVMPSTGIYNPGLNPESGWSIEGGVHGKIGAQAKWHLSIYDFHLSDAIVLQRDSSGADYYVNAGDTRQPGIELSFDWTKRYSGFAKSVSIRTAITYSAYRFGTYVYDGNDYSGNALTGIPPWTMALAADADLLADFYGALTANYASRIPLNDSSTDFANEYLLVGLRVGKRFHGKLPIDFFVGVDNLLDQVYSLGNDLNAAGKRYFNAAPRINYYAGLSARLDLRRN